MTTASPPRAPDNAPPTITTTSPSPSPAGDVAPVHTYHCICTQLLLATTTPLPSLPRRGNDNDDSALLDRAYILPLPARPPTAAAASSSNTDEAPAAAAAAGGGEKNDGGHYAILLNVQLDRRPRIVRREDGLEKRWVQRCARCACVVGYQLDWAHFAGGVGGGEKEGEGAGEGSSTPAGRTGWRRDVVYLLPEALVGTDEMARGEGPQGGGVEKGVGGK